MRTTILTCLTLGLLLQSGCAITPDFRPLARQKPQPNPKLAAKYLEAERYESQGKFERARAVYIELLEKHSDNPEYLHRLAVVCTRLHRDGEATHYFERAYALDPKNANLITDMGYTRYLRGDLPESERLLRESLHLNPTNKRTASNLALVVGKQGFLGESLLLLKQVGDEASALAGLAYIYSERGEFDLAEQRYREALAVDPDQEDAKLALAQLGKRKPQTEVFVAESEPAIESKRATVERAAVVEAQLEKPFVQQVGAEESQNVEFDVAHLEEPGLEARTPKVPAMLNDNHDKPDPMDEDDLFGDLPAPQSAPIVLDLIEAPSADDEWANVELAPKQVEKPAALLPLALPEIFEEKADEQPTPTNEKMAAGKENVASTADKPKETKPVERLKFVATKPARQPKDKTSAQLDQVIQSLDAAWDQLK